MLGKKGIKYVALLGLAAVGLALLSACSGVSAKDYDAVKAQLTTAQQEATTAAATAQQQLTAKGQELATAQQQLTAKGQEVTKLTQDLEAAQQTAKTSGQYAVTVMKAVRPNLVNTLDALKAGDVAKARTAFANYDAAWNGVEVYVQLPSRDLYYTPLEVVLQADLQKLLDAPQPDFPALVSKAEAMLAKWDEATKLVEAISYGISPIFNDVTALRIVRGDTIRWIAGQLKAGDVAGAKAKWTQFMSKWADVEDLIHERSTPAYAETEDAMGKANTAYQKTTPDVAELTALTATVLERYNYGLSLINAAARGADVTKTTYTTADVQAAAVLTNMATQLQTSLTSWKAGNYQDAGDRAVRANGTLYASVTVALKAKSGNDAALKTALDAYAGLAGKAGDASTVSAAQKKAVEAVWVAQQWLAGQFWTNPKLQEAIRQAAIAVK